MFVEDILTEIFAEGFWDKMFDTEIIAVLGHALRDPHAGVRMGTVKVFTAAMAQGVLRCFYRTFIPKYTQRGFGTGYLTLRSLPHLDVH